VTAANREPENDEAKARKENALKLIDLILSPQGQTLVEKTGYVPIG
jgi:ABC-type Fe3+ transport system substrate-binding protein